MFCQRLVKRFDFRVDVNLGHVEGRQVEPLQAFYAGQRDIRLAAFEDPAPRVDLRRVHCRPLRFMDGQGPRQNERDLGHADARDNVALPHVRAHDFFDAVVELDAGVSPAFCERDDDALAAVADLDPRVVLVLDIDDGHDLRAHFQGEILVADQFRREHVQLHLDPLLRVFEPLDLAFARGVEVHVKLHREHVFLAGEGRTVRPIDLVDALPGGVQFRRLHRQFRASFSPDILVQDLHRFPFDFPLADLVQNRRIDVVGLAEDLDQLDLILPGEDAVPLRALKAEALRVLVVSLSNRRQLEEIAGEDELDAAKRRAVFSNLLTDFV